MIENKKKTNYIVRQILESFSPKICRALLYTYLVTFNRVSYLLIKLFKLLEVFNVFKDISILIFFNRMTFSTENTIYFRRIS